MPPGYFNRVTKETPEIIEELRSKVKEFRRAYDDDGLSLEEFKGFGPVLLFRSMARGFTICPSKLLKLITACKL